MAKDIVKDRKRALDFITGIMNILDRSGKNTKLYTEKINAMSDRELISYCKSGGPLFLYIEAFESEPSFDDIMKLCDKLGCPLMEEITLPHLYKDPVTGEELVADKKAMVGPVNMRILQQLSSKETASTSDNKIRDKYNQVSGEDKAAMLSDLDVGCLTAQGCDMVQTELLTFRSDNDGGKEDAYMQILTTGKCNIPDSINDPNNKRSLQILDGLYNIAQIETNLITDIDE